MSIILNDNMKQQKTQNKKIWFRLRLEFRTPCLSERNVCQYIKKIFMYYCKASIFSGGCVDSKTSILVQFWLSLQNDALEDMAKPRYLVNKPHVCSSPPSRPRVALYSTHGDGVMVSVFLVFIGSADSSACQDCRKTRVTVSHSDSVCCFMFTLCSVTVFCRCSLLVSQQSVGGSCNTAMGLPLFLHLPEWSCVSPHSKTSCTHKRQGL